MRLQDAAQFIRRKRHNVAGLIFCLVCHHYRHEFILTPNERVLQQILRKKNPAHSRVNSVTLGLFPGVAFRRLWRARF